MPSSKPTRIAIFADGSIARNELVLRQGQSTPTPLGYDRYTQHTFGNAELLANVALALDGQDALLALRNRTIASRRLDLPRMAGRRTAFLLINVALPPLLLIIGGCIYAWRRKVRYAHRPKSNS